MTEYELVVVRGPSAGRSFPLAPGSYVVGRSSSCDITIDDPEVSRRHAELTVDENGVRIRDVGSLNGTIVEGVAIEGECAVLLREMIEIGDVALEVRVAMAPERVTLTELPDAADEWRIPIGLGPHGVPVSADLTGGHLVVVGPYRSGRTTALGTIAAVSQRLTTPPEIHLLAPRPSQLTESSAWTSVAVGREDVALALTGSGSLLGTGAKALVVFDDADEFFDDDNPELETALQRTRHSPVRFVIAAETQASHRCFGGWFLEAKKNKPGLVLQPDHVLDGQLFGVDLPREPQRFGPGGGWLIGDASVSVVQVAAQL